MLWEQFDITIKLTNSIGFHANPERQCSRANVRPSVCQLKLSRSWVMQQDKNPKHRSESESLGEAQLQSWCFGMSSRERFTPNSPRLLPKLNCYKAKLFLTVVQVCSAIMWNFWWRLLLPSFNLILNPRVFSCCTVNVYTVCSIKTEKNITVWIS